MLSKSSLYLNTTIKHNYLLFFKILYNNLNYFLVNFLFLSYIKSVLRKKKLKHNLLYTNSKNIVQKTQKMLLFKTIRFKYITKLNTSDCFVN